MEQKPEELELKYILADNQMITPEKIVNTLLANGFTIVKAKQKENDDLYYDTKDLSLLAKGGSLRIRRLTQDGKRKFKATYKMPTGDNQEFISREEIEVEIPEDTISTLITAMEQKQIDVDLSAIVQTPLLHSVTQRRDVVLDKNGVQVCFSFDTSNYTNNLLKNQTSDSMVEIETVEQTGDGTVLHEISGILQNNFPGIQTNTQSKYQRGIIKTREQAKKEASKDSEDLPR